MKSMTFFNSYKLLFNSQWHPVENKGMQELKCLCYCYYYLHLKCCCG